MAYDSRSSAALERLMPAVYDTLKGIARRQLRRRGEPHTLCTTDLVHEAYLKLAAGETLSWRDRAHFNCIAARAMRQVLVDHARRRRAAKRGGGADVIALVSRRRTVEMPWLDLLALDQALDRLDALNTRLRMVVEYRFFGGMLMDEIAAVLEVSTRTVERDWNKARLFLHRELYPGVNPD